MFSACHRHNKSFDYGPNRDKQDGRKQNQKGDATCDIMYFMTYFHRFSSLGCFSFSHSIYLKRGFLNRTGCLCQVVTQGEGTPELHSWELGHQPQIGRFVCHTMNHFQPWDTLGEYSLGKYP